MTGAESQAESPKHQGHAAAALVGFLLAGTADLAEVCVGVIADGPLVQGWGYGVSGQGRPIPTPYTKPTSRQEDKICVRHRTWKNCTLNWLPAGV